MVSLSGSLGGAVGARRMPGRGIVFRCRLTQDQIWSGSIDMVVNTVSEAKASLSELIEKASKGEEIIICRAGKPVAVLRAYRKADRPREPGALRGKIRIAPDFDELPDDIAEALGANPG